MAAVAKLQAVLGLDPREFKAGMGKATDSARGFQSDIKKIGGLIAASFSVGAIVGFGKSLVTWASDVSEAAQNAGILTSEMMALNQVGLKGGLAVDEMRRMLSKLQTELYSAAEGNEVARKKFENLGLSITDLAGLDPAAMFQKVAKAAMDSGTPISALADIFGDRLGPKAVSALRDLAENGLPSVSVAAARAADAVEDLGDKWAKFTDDAKQKIMEVTTETMKWKTVVKGFFTGGGMAGALAAYAEQEANGGIIDSTGENENRTAAMKLSKEELKRRAEEQDVLQEYKRIRAGQEAGNADSVKARENEEDTKKAKAEAAKEFSKQWDDFVKQNNDDYFANKAYGESQARVSEKAYSLLKPEGNPSSMNPDAMARIGGFFGGERAGYDVQSKQLDTQKQLVELLRESNRLAQQREEVLRAERGEVL